MPVVRLRAGTRGSLIAPARARTLSATQRRLHDAARLVVAPDPAVGRWCFPRELRPPHVHGLAQERLPQGAERRPGDGHARSEEHTSELQSQSNLVCRLLLEKKKNDTPRSPWRELGERGDRFCASETTGWF